MEMDGDGDGWSVSLHTITTPLCVTERQYETDRERQTERYVNDRSIMSSYSYLSIYLSMYVCVYVCMYLCMYVCMYVCVWMYVCVYVYHDTTVATHSRHTQLQRPQ